MRNQYPGLPNAAVTISCRDEWSETIHKAFGSNMIRRKEGEMIGRRESSLVPTRLKGERIGRREIKRERG